jgi:hypothetical protein
MSIYRFPHIALTARYMYRVLAGTAWGMALSPFELDVRLAFLACVGLVMGLLFPSFIAWDQKPVTASRLALYGLLAVGEVLAGGCVVFGALGAFTGHLHMVPMWLTGLGGSLLPLYALSVLYKDNMSRAAGSNR